MANTPLHAHQPLSQNASVDENVATPRPATSHEVATSSKEPKWQNTSSIPLRQATINTKELTCHFWATGWCKYTEDQCLYAHRQTGKVAQEPSQKEEGRPSVAGKNASRQSPMYTNWRYNRAQLIGPQIQQQLHHIQAKAQERNIHFNNQTDYNVFNVQQFESAMPQVPLLSPYSHTMYNFGGNRMESSGPQNQGYIPKYQTTSGSNEQAVIQTPGYTPHLDTPPGPSTTNEEIKDGIIQDLGHTVSDLIAHLKVQDQVIAEEAHETLRIIGMMRERNVSPPTESHNDDITGDEKASDKKVKPPMSSQRSPSKRLLSSVETTMSRLKMNREVIQGLEETKNDVRNRLDQIGEGRLLSPSRRQAP